jgi:uncharacterized sodium:solute symporter family permease YidK
MKKIMLLLSIILVTLWIAGFFLMNLHPAVHIVLAVAILLYIRSLLLVNDTATQKYYRPKKERIG